MFSVGLWSCQMDAIAVFVRCNMRSERVRREKVERRKLAPRSS